MCSSCSCEPGPTHLRTGLRCPSGHTSCAPAAQPRPAQPPSPGLRPAGAAPQRPPQQPVRCLRVQQQQSGTVWAPPRHCPRRAWCCHVQAGAAHHLPLSSVRGRALSSRLRAIVPTCCWAVKRAHRRWGCGPRVSGHDRRVTSRRHLRSGGWGQGQVKTDGCRYQDVSAGCGRTPPCLAAG
jgi:hypothetical protein